MIGMIISGHGEYAVGVAHALQMIAGQQKAFEVVPFRESAPMEQLTTDMETAVAKLLESCSGVVIYTDLLGGSPFKAAMMAANGRDSVQVVTGTNLPMLIEVALLREFADSVTTVVNQSIQAGQQGLQHVVLPAPATAVEEDEGDGI